MFGTVAKKRVRIDRNLEVLELADLLGVTATEVIKKLFYDKEIMRTVHQIVEVHIARELALAMGYELIDDEDEK